MLKIQLTILISMMLCPVWAETSGNEQFGREYADFHGYGVN